MVENAICKDLLKSTVSECIEGIVNNYENIIKDAMVMTFSDLFFNEVTKSTFNVVVDKVLNKNN